MTGRHGFISHTETWLSLTQVQVVPIVQEIQKQVLFSSCNLSHSVNCITVSEISALFRALLALAASTRLEVDSVSYESRGLLLVPGSQGQFQPDCNSAV